MAASFFNGSSPSEKARLKSLEQQFAANEVFADAGALAAAKADAQAANAAAQAALISANAAKSEAQTASANASTASNAALAAAASVDVYPSYVDAQAASKPSVRLVRWLGTDDRSVAAYRETGGPLLGGGWSPDGVVKPAHVNGSLIAAHALGGPVDYGKKLWSDEVSTGYLNLYGSSKYRSASSSRLQYGLWVSPVDDPQPITVVQKFSSASRSVDSSAWDQAGYFGLAKITGDAYGAALTGYATSRGGSGDLIGVHARCNRYSAESPSYGLWAYFGGNIESTLPGHACEMNASVSYDPGYLSEHQILRLCMADRVEDTNRFSTALSIGHATKGGNNNGVYTGIHIEANAIVKRNELDGEAIRIDAPELSGQIGGIRFAKEDSDHLGNFKYALKTDEAVFDGNRAIILGIGQKISCYSSGAETVSIYGGTERFTISGGFINVTTPISDTVLQASGVRILGPRKTGWAAATGNGSRSTFETSTVTLPSLAAKVKALIDDLLSHGLIGA